jgi:hypothetical protein
MPSTVLLRASRQESSTWITSAPSPTSAEPRPAAAHMLSTLFIAHAPRRDALAPLSSVLATSPARGFWPLALRSSFAED